MAYNIEMNLKAVIFDFDDTLVQTKPVRYGTMKEVGKTFYNQDITDQEIDKYWGRSFPELIKALIHNDDSAETMI